MPSFFSPVTLGVKQRKSVLIFLQRYCVINLLSFPCIVFEKLASETTQLLHCCC